MACKGKGHNFMHARIPVPSTLNIIMWRQLLTNYHDYIVVDYLEFGWPLNYQSSVPPLGVENGYNHKSAIAFKSVVKRNIDQDIDMGALLGPFSYEPFTDKLVISPMQIVTKDVNKHRLVIDASFPNGSSLNDGIPSTNFLQDPLELKYPSVESLAKIIRQKGKGCLMFKTDLKNAYKQIPTSPNDWHLCGISWNGQKYVYIREFFGLRSSALACQRTSQCVQFLMKNKDTQ